MISGLAYFFGLHIFGAICLVGWIQNSPQKYLDWLAECGQDKNWWYGDLLSMSIIFFNNIHRAFYSAQTMVDNLGFTLTPDSMYVSMKERCRCCKSKSANTHIS